MRNVPIEEGPTHHLSTEECHLTWFWRKDKGSVSKWDACLEQQAEEVEEETRGSCT